ncbi:MAG: hypothetical protein N2C12_16970, partial [Planctomycetales bacterium]
LHVAAFLCRSEIIQQLLEHGGVTSLKNDRGETPIDVVSSTWSKELADFYTMNGGLEGLELDLERMQRERPKIAKILREHSAKQSANR